MVAAQIYGSQELPPPQLHSNVVFQRSKNQISMRAAPLPKRVPSAQVNKKPNNKWALFTKNNEYSLFLGGTYLPNMISGQTLQLTPYEHGLYADTFTQQSDSGTFTWGLGLGHRYYISPTNKLGNLFDSFAINAQFFELIPSNQTGHVLQFGLAEFDNYTYQLGVSNYRFMADGDLDFDPIWNVVGFIEAGVGAASTTISYGSTPIAPVLDPGLKLNKKTNWSFAYQAGAGLKFPTFRHCELSLRYLYANMGTMNSSVNGSTDILEKPLQVDMNTHNVLLGLSYKGDYIEK